MRTLCGESKEPCGEFIPHHRVYQEDVNNGDYTRRGALMARAPITHRNPYTPHSGQFAGQTFHSERQYRNALARQKGFTSWSQQQRAPKPIHTPHAAGRLSPAAREARQDALHALSLMRRGSSLQAAARAAHTTPNTVHRYAGSALVKSGGRYVAKPRDKLYRPLRFLTPNGAITLDVRDSRTASTIARYMNAVRDYVTTGNDLRLRAFRGKAVHVGGQRREFVTDLDVLDRLGYAGELHFEDLYDLAA